MSWNLHHDIGFRPGNRKKGESPETPEYRAAFHLTTPDKWKNDPQKPVYFNGKYHYYYLYNRDYPDGNGTEWRHAVSDDLVHWQDQGVAIPKYTNKNGDPWSGSVVVDSQNTAGFGKGAIVAIMTQPSANDGKEEQFYGTAKMVEKHLNLTVKSRYCLIRTPSISETRK